MGYPNRRVSMTDVHGEPQQGGYLPAEIWHDYMSEVTAGQSCARFPSPRESISYRPFYGKYAKTGHGEFQQSNEALPPIERLPPYERASPPTGQHRQPGPQAEHEAPARPSHEAGGGEKGKPAEPSAPAPAPAPASTEPAKAPQPAPAPGAAPSPAGGGASP